MEFHLAVKEEKLVCPKCGTGQRRNDPTWRCDHRGQTHLIPSRPAAMLPTTSFILDLPDDIGQRLIDHDTDTDTKAQSGVPLPS